MESPAIKHSISVTDSIKNEAQNTQNSKIIVVTRCLSEKCTGLYTDSLSETVLVRCLDSKHNIGKEGCKGPQPKATNLIPSTADVTPPDGMTKGGIYNVK
jgi:hypothetical protein